MSAIARFAASNPTAPLGPKPFSTGHCSAQSALRIWANRRNGARDKLKRPPTEAALLAPSFLAAFAFKYADGFPTAGVQHVKMQSGLGVAALAPADFAGLRLRSTFRHQVDLVKGQPNTDA